MKFYNKLTGLLLAAGLGLSACAEQAQRVPASYIPSLVFRGASCAELNEEQRVLAMHVRHVADLQRNSAQWDTAAVFFYSTFIFFPAILALPLTVDQQAQLASARGFYDAIVKARIEQGCITGHPSAPGQVRSYGQSPSYGHTVTVPNWKRYPGQFPPM
ncbi:hypothetical protein [Marivita sp.]|jgi:hypothetical protein|uniref:hypothetical protein n=1 Tax=Marivita sp. TaxID=2003365 RepID=UPI003F710356